MQGKIRKFFWLLAILFPTHLLSAEETKIEEKNSPPQPIIIPSLLKNLKGCATCGNNVIAQLNRKLEDLRKAHQEDDKKEEEAKIRQKQEEQHKLDFTQPLKKDPEKGIVMVRPVIKQFT